MKLIYFNQRGIVEPIRLLLAYVEEPYDDIRYPMKASMHGFAPDARFQRDKANGDFAANLNSLPILEFNGHKIGQSNAILRFLARRHGLAGKTPIEEAQVDAVCEHVRDIKQRWYKAKSRTFVEEEMPRLLGLLEHAVQGGLWLVGDSMTVADIVVYHLLAAPQSVMMGTIDSFFDGHVVALPDRFRRLVDAIAQIPAIKRWEESRPDTFN